jgi:hypothetical protein
MTTAARANNTASAGGEDERGQSLSRCLPSADDSGLRVVRSHTSQNCVSHQNKEGTDPVSCPGAEQGASKRLTTTMAAGGRLLTRVLPTASTYVIVFSLNIGSA